MGMKRGLFVLLKGNKNLKGGKGYDFGLKHRLLLPEFVYKSSRYFRDADHKLGEV
jgi:hypothetical protein